MGRDGVGRGAMAGAPVALAKGHSMQHCPLHHIVYQPTAPAEDSLALNLILAGCTGGIFLLGVLVMTVIARLPR